jgi:tRNA A-37 threonylcarbamoyl transferase component Bud32
MFDSLKLADLNETSARLLREPTKTRPPIWFVEEGGHKAVVKDFSRQGWLYRNIVGRALIWREKKAYNMLQGIEGVPCLYRTIPGNALIIEAVEGQDLRSFEEELVAMIQDGVDPSVLEEKRRFLSPVFFEKLKKLVDKIHERGMAHCDLKRTPNIMIGKNGSPYIVDWAAFMAKSESRVFPMNILYRRFLQDDCLAITKLKVNNRPDLATEEEHQAYRDYKAGREEAGIERVVRELRKKIREVLKKMA